MSIARLIRNLVGWAVVLGCMGTLVDVTRSMGVKAAFATKTGMMSLGRLNRMLQNR